MFVHETGALAVWRDFMIVPTNVWDSLFGADALQVHANEITAGLITAAAIATGAIDADALATDAVAEIADGVWDEPKAGHVGVTTFGDLATDLDTVVVDVAGLDGAAMRGTDSAALASVCTEARLAELDAANLPTDVAGVQSDTDNIQTRLPAALVGGRIDADIGAKTGNVALSTQEKADVNVEVVDALNVDTYAEPGQATPPATTTLVQKISYLFKAWRNRNTQSATQYGLYNDDAVTLDQKATFADDGTTADRGEVATGP